MDQVLFLTAYPNQNEAGTGLSPGKTDTHIKEDAIGKVLPEKVTRLHAEMADKDDINESELAEGVKGIPVSPINIEFEKFDKVYIPIFISKAIVACYLSYILQRPGVSCAH